MLRVRRQLLRAAFAAALALLGVVVTPSAASSPGSLLVGDAPALAPHSTALGNVAANTALGLTVVLRSRDPAGLAALATAVSTPGSPDYHHYLSVSEFAQRFGASPQALAAVDSTLRADGLAPATVAADGLSLSVAGDAATVSHAFAVNLERYREPSGAEVFANTAAARLPASLQGDVTDILGLSDVPLAAPAGLARDTVARAGDEGGDAQLDPHSGQPAPCIAAQALARNGGPYTINQVADAYGLEPLYGTGDVGSGVTVALYELEPYSTTDINTFQQCFGTSVTPTVDDVDGGPGGSGAGSGEAALDIENVIGLVPGANVKIYDGPNGGGGPYQTLAAIVNDPSPAQVVSDSWGLCEPTVQGEGSLTTDEYALFEQAAVQGQSVLAASGDDGSEDCGTASLAVDDPASQPYVTGVGGTALTATGTPPSESAWNTIPSLGANGGASGGGISTLWTMPGYQADSNVAGVVNTYSSGTPCGASSGYCREVPDVAADADPQTGYVIYYGGAWGVYAGTSAAAPFWAGLIALADASGAGSCAPGSPLGFLNPNLYAIAAGPGSADAFNDITSGDNNPSGSGDYPATTGYDLTTGLGTPIATDGASAGLVDQLCDAPAGSGRPPAVSGLSAHDAAAGSTLTIDGSGFTGAASVSFGTVAASAVTVADSGHITVTVPAGSGTVDVTVATAAGTSATGAADQFTFGPAASITTPANGSTYTVGQQVLAAYACSASTSGTPTCDGTTASGAAVDTAAVGSYQFTVTATDANGVSVSQTASYAVVAAPKITIAAPLNGATFVKGQAVKASYSCTTSAPLTIATCRGSVASGHRLATGSLGQFYLTVQATDSNGVAVARTASYDVVAQRATISSLGESAHVWLERPLAGSHLSVGTRFSFWLDEPSTVTVRFTKLIGGHRAGARCVAGAGARACTITRGAGTISVRALAGHHSIAFAGKTSAGMLAAGRYLATVVAVGRAGHASAVAAVRFTIAAERRH